MRIETYKNYNPKVKRMTQPKAIILEVFGKMDYTLKYLEKMRPQVYDEYVAAFKKRLADEVGDFSFDANRFDLSEAREGYGPLNDLLDVQDLIVQVVAKYLPLPAEYVPDEEEIEVVVLEEMKATFLVPYLRVKAFTDVLGREEGIQLWKDLVIQIIDDEMDDIEERPPMPEFIELSIKGFAEGNASDFTAVVYDDHKMLLKFDRCIVHEAFTYLNDPEIVFLSYCWTGNVEDERTTNIRRRRRSESLHLGEFCDEFFWDNDVHPDAEHPSLEFMRGLGKE